MRSASTLVGFPNLMVQVLDEIGVDLTASMATAPKGRLAQRQGQAAASSSKDTEDDDLTARLSALR